MLAWLRDLTSRERRTMLACWGGWTLDGFDQQLYSYVVPTVIAVWGMSTAAAGTIGTVTVVTSAFGGWFAGALADRFGRVSMLQIAILWYSVFTVLCGFAQNFEQLFILRGLHGLGFGGPPHPTASPPLMSPLGYAHSANKAHHSTAPATPLTI